MKSTKKRTRWVVGYLVVVSRGTVWTWLVHDNGILKKTWCHGLVMRSPWKIGY